jgi:hypothetical protein
MDGSEFWICLGLRYKHVDLVSTAIAVGIGLLFLSYFLAELQEMSETQLSFLWTILPRDSYRLFVPGNFQKEQQLLPRNIWAVDVSNVWNDGCWTYCDIFSGDMPEEENEE